MQAWGDDRNAANMVSTEAARGKAPLRAEAVLLWQKDCVVINKGLGRTDGLGTATVGGKEAIKHRRNTERNQVENTVENKKNSSA